MEQDYPADETGLGIKSDPIIQRILAQLPRQSRDSFTEDQLLALKTAFGARRWFKHPLDLRGSVSLWRLRIYYVILAGAEKRSLSYREKRRARMANLLLAGAVLGISVVGGLMVLYLVKSALGVDLIPGWSLGLWEWFHATW